MSRDVQDGLAEAEAAVSRLDDVLAVRSVIDRESCEVHVLAAPRRAAEEVAADVRSIMAVHVRDLPLRDVHVVRLAPDVEPAAAATPAGDIAREASRIELVDVVVLHEERATRVLSTLRRGEERVTGSATTIAAAASIRRAVADATLTALLELTGRPTDLAVESVVLVPLPTHQVVLVVIEMAASADTSLLGAALVRSNGVYDAVGRAVLDATNRTLGRRPTSSP